LLRGLLGLQAAPLPDQEPRECVEQVCDGHGVLRR
jgi:hypothetical protein